MDVKVENEWTVGHLIDLQREQILRVNHEYQRGLRWILMQKCMFIDSIFRAIRSCILFPLERNISGIHL